MKVGIIGAGLSGLSAARELVAAGHDVVVVEKSRGVGGRLATRRVAGTVVDHGAPVIDAADGTDLRALIDGLPSEDVVQLSGGGMAYRSGATRLAKLMADGLDVVLGVRIAALRQTRAGFELGGEQGNTHGVVDAVVVSAPAPQAADLLAQSPVDGDRVDLLRTARYEPAIVLLAGLGMHPPAALEPFALPAPFARITVESVKGRPPIDGVVPVVAQLNPSMSAALLAVADDDILSEFSRGLAAVCGAPGEPVWAQVKRWRFATLPTPLDAALVNPPGSRIVVCGDTVAAGGLSEVAASGVAAARALIGELSG